MGISYVQSNFRVSLISSIFELEDVYLTNIGHLCFIINLLSAVNVFSCISVV